jgi:hypothetical protein
MLSSSRAADDRPDAPEANYVPATQSSGVRAPPIFQRGVPASTGPMGNHPTRPAPVRDPQGPLWVHEQRPQRHSPAVSLTPKSRPVFDAEAYGR